MTQYGDVWCVHFATGCSWEDRRGKHKLKMLEVMKLIYSMYTLSFQKLNIIYAHEDGMV